MLVILTKYSQNGAEIPDLGCIFDFWHGFSPHHMLVSNASSFANGVDSPPILVQWGENMVVFLPPEQKFSPPIWGEKNTIS